MKGFLNRAEALRFEDSVGMKKAAITSRKYGKGWKIEINYFDPIE